MMKRYYSDGMRSRHAAEPLLVAGAGGLGSFVVAGLMGYTRPVVVDNDVVEERNLNRQFWYRKEDVGRRKVDILMERTGGRIVPLFSDVRDVPLERFGLIIDCLDDWEVKAWLLREGLKRGIPVVVLSAGEGKGFVSVPTKPLPFSPRRNRWVEAPEVMMAASLGVREALRILEGREPLLKDKILFFDLEKNVFYVSGLPDG